MIDYNHLNKFKNILVTGGAGFIGGTFIRRLIKKTNCKIYNLDKLSYSSSLEGIKLVKDSKLKHLHLLVDLYHYDDTFNALKESNPDLIIHFAAETHVDRSIDSPNSFIESNVIGTYNLLEATKNYWYGLSKKKREIFRFHHISTDEVFGSLSSIGSFDESTPYSPRSPYSASKASSDHLVHAWHKTYGLPAITTNCSNNYGPYQFPEKLIPLSILKAVQGKEIPIYGNGENIRDWLYVEDHIDAILLAIIKGKIGESYCIGGFGEMSNKTIACLLCDVLDSIVPKKNAYSTLINYVEDRPGHDKRYSINSSKIQRELGWKPLHSLENGIRKTVLWYLNNLDWCDKINKRSSYNGKRLGKMNVQLMQ